MPNGGVPLNMVIELNDSVTLRARGADIAVTQDGEAIATWGPDESKAIASFLRYWLGGGLSEGGGQVDPTANPLAGRHMPNVVYDY